MIYAAFLCYRLGIISDHAAEAGWLYLIHPILFSSSVLLQGQ